MGGAIVALQEGDALQAAILAAIGASGLRPRGLVPAGLMASPRQSHRTAGRPATPPVGLPWVSRTSSMLAGTRGVDMGG